MKDDKSILKDENYGKVDIETRKKQIKKLLTEGIKARHRKQANSFCFKRESFKYTSLKVKEGEKLKKRIKKEELPLGIYLPYSFY